MPSKFQLVAVLAILSPVFAVPVADPKATLPGHRRPTLHPTGEYAYPYTGKVTREPTAWTRIPFVSSTLTRAVPIQTQNSDTTPSISAFAGQATAISHRNVDGANNASDVDDARGDEHIQQIGEGGFKCRESPEGHLVCGPKHVPLWTSTAPQQSSVTTTALSEEVSLSTAMQALVDSTQGLKGQPIQEGMACLMRDPEADVDIRENICAPLLQEIPSQYKCTVSDKGALHCQPSSGASLGVPLSSTKDGRSEDSA